MNDDNIINFEDFKSKLLNVNNNIEQEFEIDIDLFNSIIQKIKKEEEYKENFKLKLENIENKLNKIDEKIIKINKLINKLL